MQNTHLRIRGRFKQKSQGKSEEAAKKKVDLEIKCMAGVGGIKATTAEGIMKEKTYMVVCVWVVA